MRDYRIVSDEFGFFWVERGSFSQIDYELDFECVQWVTCSSLCKTKDEANQYLLDELMRNDEAHKGFEIITEPDEGCCTDEQNSDPTSKYFEIVSPSWKQLVDYFNS